MPVLVVYCYWRHGRQFAEECRVGEVQPTLLDVEVLRDGRLDPVLDAVVQGDEYMIYDLLRIRSVGARAVTRAHH